VTIRDVELQPPRPFIVMDYLPNGSVGARLERGEVTVLDAVRWTREALDGLAHAHALGVMHRDIKPTNLLIDETGGAVLSDFGLAEDTVRRRIVHADYLYGAHAAPELRAGGLTTPASDCFALGCTAYRLLSSEYPYADKRAAAAGDHVPVHEHNPQIPNSLSKFVSKALAPRPDDRFASAHEMRGAVLKCSVFGSWTKVSELPNERWVATNEDASYELSIAPSKHGYMLLVRRDLGKGFRHLTREEARSPAKLSQARRRLLRKLVEGKEFV
jgi:serine/threonine-protein kinase